MTTTSSTQHPTVTPISGGKQLTVGSVVNLPTILNTVTVTVNLDPSIDTFYVPTGITEFVIKDINNLSNISAYRLAHLEPISGNATSINVGDTVDSDKYIEVQVFLINDFIPSSIDLVLEPTNSSKTISSEWIQVEINNGSYYMTDRYYTGLDDYKFGIIQNQDVGETRQFMGANAYSEKTFSGEFEIETLMSGLQAICLDPLTPVNPAPNLFLTTEIAIYKLPNAIRIYTNGTLQYNNSSSLIQWSQVIKVKLVADGTDMHLYINDVNSYSFSYNSSTEYFVIPVLPGSDAAMDGLAYFNGIRYR